METDEFLTIRKEAEGFYKEKGSKFYGLAFPVENEEQIKEKLEEVKARFHDARHHCYAYRYGIDHEYYRMNDDGEPSSTAGKPIYGQILSHNVTNVLIVVVRYFGGTLLGTSGLIRSYKSAAEDALNHAHLIKKTIQTQYTIDFDYSLMNDVMKVLHEENLVPLKKEFGAACRFTLGFRRSREKSLVQRFSQIHELTLQKKEKEQDS